jgi:hypothetical protein
MVYSRTNLGLFTMYGGSTQAMFMGEVFADTLPDVMARLAAGEVILDDAGTTWFMALPVPGRTSHERIVAALGKYGHLSSGPLGMVAGCSRSRIRLLARKSSEFGVVAKGRNASGTQYPIYGLYQKTPNEKGGERGISHDHERY